MRAPVYAEENASPLSVELAQLRAAIEPLLDVASDDLKQRAVEALNALEAACKATVPVRRGGCKVGYGLDKAQKAIACDTMIAIVRQIKAERAW